MNSEDKETIKTIKAWLDSYPKRRGIVVLFDDEDMSVLDLANTSGLHAVEFATRYLKFVEDTVGIKDMLIEDAIIKPDDKTKHQAKEVR